MLRGNKGEWSEIYVLLKLLADGKVYAADEKLNKLEKVYFPIIKILREEVKGNINEYKIGETVEIFINGCQVKKIPREIFEDKSSELLIEMNNQKSKGAFSIERIENFMHEIYCYRLSAPSIDKTDIRIKLIDINTGFSPIVGFSIKSELGSPPTLLNAGKTTNFIFEIVHNYSELVNETNEIYKVARGENKTDVRGRITKIIDVGGKIEYYAMENEIFNDNLVLIDSNMDKIIAKTLLYFYRDGISACEEMVAKLKAENPMRFGNVNAYSYKFKKFLIAVALGMKPATIWDGTDEATGGYIIVTREGRVLAYHIYNRNFFEDYLLKNTKYETASTSRHGFGYLYEENGKSLIKLNLQVRFK